MDGKQGPDTVPTTLRGTEGFSAGNRGEDRGAADCGARTDATAGHRACCLSASPAGDGAGLIDQIRQLEDLKSAAAQQARIAVALALLRSREQADAGDFSAEGFVAGESGKATDAMATNMAGSLSAPLAVRFNVRPSRET
jgi:hypothetical protein